jgi:glucose/arabinose dehydrogenase
VGGTGGVGGTGDLCRGIELPTGQYYVQNGLCVRAVAANQGQLRQITFDAQGALLGVTVNGAILRYRDLNNDGMYSGAEEISQIADTGGNGHNVHYDVTSGYLYAGTPTGVRRWAYQPTATTLGAGEQVVIDQPSTGLNPFHTVHLYDGWLYVSSGSESNVATPAAPAYDTHRSVLKRFRISDFTAGTPFAWTSGEVYSAGIGNMLGFTRNQLGRMYGVDTGIDNLVYANQDEHLDNPGDELLLLQPGGTYGYPYCFTASHIVANNIVVNPGTQLATGVSGFTNPHDDLWCANNSAAPITFVPPHSSPTDLVFFDAAAPAGGLPETLRGGAFVALHGSNNLTPSVGYQVIYVPFTANGTATRPTADQDRTTFPFPVIFGGAAGTSAVAGRWQWQSGAFGENPVRPIGVAISPIDGALYISSDNGSVSAGTPQGYIYRVATQR